MPEKQTNNVFFKSFSNIFPAAILSVFLLFTVSYRGMASDDDNIFYLKNKSYFIDEGEIFYYGNYYSQSAINVDLFLFNDEFTNVIYFELFVPNGSDSLVTGTYNLSLSKINDHLPFSYAWGEMYIEEEDRFFDVIDGVLTAFVTGSGDDEVYFIVIDCIFKAEDTGEEFPVRGTFRGSITWFDET